jgi:hypothetical protein
MIVNFFEAVIVKRKSMKLSNVVTFFFFGQVIEHFFSGAFELQDGVDTTAITVTISFFFLCIFTYCRMELTWFFQLLG